MTFSRRDQQRIEQVAGIISENFVSPREARKLNNDGWTYNVRFDWEDYVDSTSYTRMENDVLSDEMLEAAIKLARKSWSRDDLIYILEYLRRTSN